MPPLPRKTALSILLFGLFAGGYEWASRLESKPRSMPPAPPPARAPQAPPPNLAIAAGSLDRFFRALGRAAAKEPGAVATVLHYGDSPTTADSITADVRRLLQQRFGDAGHGFVLIAKPWAWYGHNGIELSSDGFTSEPATGQRAPDGIHGLGGVSFRGGPGAVSHIKSARAHDRVRVYYQARPEGGVFAVAAGAAALGEIDTGAPEKRMASAEFALPAAAEGGEGTAGISLRVVKGQVRLFGYRLDKDGPGVRYSSLGVNGAQVQMVLRYFEKTQWTEALRAEDPDLVVLNYGTNESVYPEYIEKQYPAELRAVVDRLRAALPQASILIMSPMDRGAMQGGEIVTPEVLPKIVAIQRQVAADTGCAFFDTFDAMGGAGTMAKWYREEPRLVSADFIHPLPQGAAKVGKLLYDALIAAYEGAPK